MVALDFVELLLLLLAAQAFLFIAIALWRLSKYQRRQFEWNMRFRTKQAANLSPETYQTLQELMEHDSAISYRRWHSSNRNGDLKSLLNEFESISLGVNQGIYDEEMVRRSVGHLMVSAFPVLRSAIYQLRSQNTAPSLFLEYEQLARRWNEKQEKEGISNPDPSLK